MLLKLNRIHNRCVMYWLGPDSVWKSSNQPRFTGSYQCNGQDNHKALEDMHRDFIQNGYQSEIIDEQTAETIQRYWRPIPFGARG